MAWRPRRPQGAPAGTGPGVLTRATISQDSRPTRALWHLARSERLAHALHPVLRKEPPPLPPALEALSQLRQAALEEGGARELAPSVDDEHGHARVEAGGDERVGALVDDRDGAQRRRGRSVGNLSDLAERYLVRWGLNFKNLAGWSKTPREVGAQLRR